MDKTAPSIQYEHEQNHLPTVLVAGGAGFLGSWLVESLLTQQVRVIVVDNLLNGKREYFKKFFDNPNFVFKDQDLNHDFKVEEKVDYVFHLAGVEDYINGVDVNLDTLLVNSLGTKYLLDKSVADKAKFLFVSGININEPILCDNYLGDLEKIDSRRFSYQEAKKFAEAMVIEYFNKQEVDARIVRITDAYGPRMPLEAGGILAKLIKQAVKNENLTIPGSGLSPLRPTHVSDIVYGIMKAMFAGNTKGRVFVLVNEEEINALKTATIIQQIQVHHPNIVFDKNAKENSYSTRVDLSQTKDILGWKPKIGLETGLKETIEYFEKNTEAGIIPQEKLEIKAKEMVIKLEKIGQKAKTIPKLKFLNISSIKLPKLDINFPVFRFGVIVSIIFLYFLPLLTIMLPTYQAYANLKTLPDLIKKREFVKAKGLAIKAEQKIIISQKRYESFGFLYPKFLKQNSEDGLYFVLHLTRAAEYGINLAEPMQDVLKSITEPTMEANIPYLTSNALLDLDQLSQEIQLIENINFKPPKQFSGVISSLTGSSKMITNIRDLLSILPDVTLDKKYLLLLQNNMELRPGGGFIGSFGIISFKKNRLEPIKIQNIYSIDDSFKGRIIPPDEILHYLGNNNWYLRDSNVSPSFTLNAQRAAWFLDKETGLSVDGVIAIDLTTVQYLLGAIGDITIDGEKINETNLFQKAETVSEINFFPGSTQKEDYLGKIGNSLMQKILHLTPENYPAFLKAIDKALQEKHLQIFFQDHDIQKIIQRQGWLGEIAPTAIMFSESNYGANKANAYVTRGVNYETTINKDGTIISKLNVKYKNNSPSNTWPGGDYKAYVKVYAPLGSKIKEVLFNNRAMYVSPYLRDDVLRKTLDKQLIIQSQELSHETFATLINIPVKKEGELSFEWISNERVNVENNNTEIDINFLKQPGTNNDPLNITINYPAFLKIVSTIPPALASTQTVRYNTDLTVDRSLKIQFTK